MYPQRLVYWCMRTSKSRFVSAACSGSRHNVVDKVLGDETDLHYHRLATVGYWFMTMIPCMVAWGT